MSSKASSSSRTNSPRAMPVETIITRFKSAQQKRQLREMDRSMNKITELLKNPIKRKVKNPKNQLKKPQLKSPSSSPTLRKKKPDKMEDLEECEEVDEEYYPLKLKRQVVQNKIQLKPKHELKLIGQANKRKRSIPQKGRISTTLEDSSPESSVGSPTDSRNSSPKHKRMKQLTQNVSMMDMDEMIQLIEETGSMGDEDLLEILTCPSPVWWEDPPDGYIEDALFTRPRSTAEMYPSVRSQLQDNLMDRKRSNTPNVLSRKKRINGKRVSTTAKEGQKRETVEKSNECRDIDLGISLTNCDEAFIEKRSKLESVLGNLRSKTVNSNDAAPATAPAMTSDDTSANSVSVSNKVSVIKNLCPNQAEQATRIDGTFDHNYIELDKYSNVSDYTDMYSDISDDERLTDMSFHDDDYLNVFENMNIPVQGNSSVQVQQPLAEETCELCTSAGNNESAVVAPFPNVNPNFKTVTPADLNVRTIECCDTVSSCTVDNRGIVQRYVDNGTLDPTYSDRQTSIIEEYLEMELFEEDTVNKNRSLFAGDDQYFRCDAPLNSEVLQFNPESNTTSSVIKFRNSDESSINVLKIESLVPRSLPPLKQSDKRKNYDGCMPVNLPPLRRNPGVIQTNFESLKSTKSNSRESLNNSSANDNLDAISDTNICFLNDDDKDHGVERNSENNNELEITSVIKPSNSVLQTNHLNSTMLNLTPTNNMYGQNLNFSKTNDLNDGNNFPQNIGLYADDFAYAQNSEVDFQSLTITKMNGANVCKPAETTVDSVIIMQNNKTTKKFNDFEEEKFLRTYDLIPVGPKTNSRTNNNSNNTYGSSNSNKTSTNNKSEKAKRDCEYVTLYKIVADEPNANEKIKINRQNTFAVPNLKSSYKESKFNPNEKIDKDKVNFYFKKCKNLYWKHKNFEKNANKNIPSNDKTGLLEIRKEAKHNLEINKTNNTSNVHKSSSNAKRDNAKNEAPKYKEKAIDGKKGAKNNVENKPIVNNSTKVSNPTTNVKKDNGIQSDARKGNDKVTNSSSVTGKKEKKCIIVSNTKQIRYCMKCSSIFDTAKCNYCFGKKGAERKNERQTNPDYILKMEQCFTCDVCRYKALSKDSLERHMLSKCCESKKR